MKHYLNNANVANSLWNLADIFLYPVCFFVTVPFFIEKLGTTGFGVWMLINTIIVSMQVFNFGIGPAVLKNVAYYIGLNNKKQLNIVLNNALSITLMLFFFSVLCTALLAIAVYYFGFLNVDKPQRLLSAQCIVLSGAIIGFRFLEQVLTNFYKAHERFKDAAIISTGNRIMPLLLNIYLLTLSGTTIIHLLVTIIVLNAIIVAWSYFKIRKGLQPFTFRFLLKPQFRLSRYALIVWIQSIAMIFIFQADRFLVVYLFGLSILSYYALTATIFNHLHMGFNAVLGWIAPKFTKLYANNHDTQQLYMAAQHLVILISTFSLLVLYFIYPFLFTLILGKDIITQISIYVDYFIVFELFFAAGIVPSFYFNAVGYEVKLLNFVICFAISAVVTMLLFVYLIPQSVSVLYGLIISCGIAMFILNIMVEYFMFNAKSNWLRPLKYMVSPVLTGCFILFAGNTYKWVFLCTLLIFIYAVLVSGNRRSFKLLFQS